MNKKLTVKKDYHTEKDLPPHCCLNNSILYIGHLKIPKHKKIKMKKMTQLQKFLILRMTSDI